MLRALVFCALALGGSASHAAPLSADAFEAYTTGKTLYFSEDGEIYGAERYMPGAVWNGRSWMVNASPVSGTPTGLQFALSMKIAQTRNAGSLSVLRRACAQHLWAMRKAQSSMRPSKLVNRCIVLGRRSEYRSEVQSAVFQSAGSLILPMYQSVF